MAARQSGICHIYCRLVSALYFLNKLLLLWHSLHLIIFSYDYLCFSYPTRFSLFITVCVHLECIVMVIRNHHLEKITQLDVIIVTASNHLFLLQLCWSVFIFSCINSFIFLFVWYIRSLSKWHALMRYGIFVINIQQSLHVTNVHPNWHWILFWFWNPSPNFRICILWPVL